MAYSILYAPFVAGFIVLLSHIVLGREVLKRGIIFIDLAIAQFAGLGIILGHFLGIDAAGWGVQAVAFGSALAGATLLAFTEQYIVKQLEAFIGILFILAATGSILLLANDPHANETLKDLLVGQILWVEFKQLIIPALVSIAIFISALFMPTLFSSKAFYFIFAVAITSSVQLVGIYLVFSSLIIPALLFFKSNRQRALFGSLLFGSLAYAIGLLLSAFYDLPSGPTIVWTLAALALIAQSANIALKKI